MNEFENVYKNMQKEFSDKSEETRLQINQLLKSFENEIFKNLEKKANKSDMQNQLNEKDKQISILTKIIKI